MNETIEKIYTWSDWIIALSFVSALIMMLVLIIVTSILIMAEIKEEWDVIIWSIKKLCSKD